MSSSNEKNSTSGSNIADYSLGVDMSEGVLRARFQRQKDYMRKLRKHIDDTDWSTDFWDLTSNDRSYEHFLETGGPSHSLPPGYWKAEGVTMQQPILGISQASTPIYDIDLATEGFDCGTILVTNPSLQQLCELGDRLESEIEDFDLNPKFLLEHLTTSSKPSFTQNSRFMCSVEAWAVETTPRPLEFLLDKPEGLGDSLLSKTLIRVSCYQIKEALFLVLVRVPQILLSRRPQETAAAIPVSGWDLYYKSPKRLQCLPGHIARCLGDFFSTEWNCKRIHSLWKTTPKMWEAEPNDDRKGRTFLWIIALQGFQRKINRLINEIQALDYELIKLPSREALSRIKKSRGEVAEVRQDIACYRDAVRSNGVVECYQLLSHESVIDERDQTARQKASSSFDEEYAWLDGMAKDAMPLLNQNLQLIMATMSIEQTEMALEEARVSKRNSERSTVFAGLAAFYLPLSLATGVFGMNVRGVDQDHPQSWWIFAVVAVMLTSLSLVFVWAFSTKMRCSMRFCEEAWHRLKQSRWIAARQVVDVENGRPQSVGESIRSCTFTGETSGHGAEGWRRELGKDRIVYCEEV